MINYRFPITASDKKQAIHFFIIIASVLTLAGCHSSVSNQDANQTKAQKTSISNANIYNNYVQQINNLPNTFVKRHSFGNYETAEVDYWGFTQAKDQLGTQIKADASLNAAQKTSLSQALQNKTGGDCDATAGQINSSADNSIQQGGCNDLNDNSFTRVYIARNGIEKYTKLRMACGQ